MLRLIDVAYGPNVITWGNVIWMDVDVDKHNYERENILFTLQTRGRIIKDMPYSSSNRLNVDATVWATISSVVLWNIWIDRCRKRVSANKAKSCSLCDGNLVNANFN